MKLFGEKLLKNSTYEYHKDQTEYLNLNLKENVKKIHMDLGESNDLVIRDIKLEDKNEIDIAIIYIEGLTDTVSIQNHIIEPLLLEKKNS
ncbi:hypothetical protein IAW_06074 [Bacillus cereus str. Schrouff]|uniref:spore germination protein n=1 Tax=Bacillus cereus TaxID=1396 RepID=UPI00032D9719|nr:spore germination protein [Bacillus cereus]EOO04670.1 hypothetical protein IAW_06074 [Bacillus cereus str. Schrouff]EOO81573.1 hypothetical protein IGY_05799 [Bacillus cereus K-5975c]